MQQSSLRGGSARAASCARGPTVLPSAAVPAPRRSRASWAPSRSSNSPPALQSLHGSSAEAPTAERPEPAALLPIPNPAFLPAASPPAAPAQAAAAAQAPPPPQQQQQQQQQQPASGTSYAEALQASLSRTSVSADDLAALPTTADSQPSRLQAPWLRRPGATEPWSPPVDSASRTLLQLEGGIGGGGEEEAHAPRQLTEEEETVQQWQEEAAAHAPGFNSSCRLAVPGLAEAAIVSRGGRAYSGWRSSNQDAFAATRVGGTASTPPALFLAVLDGHGPAGDAASRAAADGLESAVPSLLSQLADAAAAAQDGSSGSSIDAGSSSSSSVAQEALVRAFQAVGASMTASGAFVDSGAAAVACLVEPGRVTAAWAGDCRAVVGVSLQAQQQQQAQQQGGSPHSAGDYLVHALTTDHVPNSPLEQARIEASGKAQVVLLRPGQPHRLCGFAGTNTLALSRAFGDSWAAELGLTHEPDAVSLTLLASSAAAAASDGRGEASPSSSSPPPSSSAGSAPQRGGAFTGSPLDTLGSTLGSSSIGSTDAEEPTAAAAAGRHVLVMGCDGLWDVMSNNDAVGLALSCPNAEAAAAALVGAAHRAWAAAYKGEHVDDVTVAVAFF